MSFRGLFRPSENRKRRRRARSKPTPRTHGGRISSSTNSRCSLALAHLRLSLTVATDVVTASVGSAVSPRGDGRSESELFLVRGEELDFSGPRSPRRVERAKVVRPLGGVLLLPKPLLLLLATTSRDRRWTVWVTARCHRHARTTHGTGLAPSRRGQNHL